MHDGQVRWVRVMRLFLLLAEACCAVALSDRCHPMQRKRTD